MIGRKQRREQRHRRQPVRAVLVVLPPLVQHDVALVRELGLGQRRQQVAHAIRFHPQRELERAGRHDLPVVGAIGVGRSVERRARALQRLEEAADRGAAIPRTSGARTGARSRSGRAARSSTRRDTRGSPRRSGRRGLRAAARRVRCRACACVKEMFTGSCRRSACSCRSTGCRSSPSVCSHGFWTIGQIGDAARLPARFRLQPGHVGVDRLAQRAELLARVRDLRSLTASCERAAMSIFIAGAPSAVAAVAMLAGVGLATPSILSSRQRRLNLEVRIDDRARLIVGGSGLRRLAGQPAHDAPAITSQRKHENTKPFLEQTALVLSCFRGRSICLISPPSAESSAGCSSRSRPARRCAPPRP